ncbi:MAG: hypothetical protein RJA61_567, partial [Candidatus Parcubacteria bacterium]
MFFLSTFKALKRQAIFVLMVLTLVSFLPAPVIAESGVPAVMSYQGRLTDSNGDLVGSTSGTTYYFKFSIWDNSTVGSGTQVWPLSSPSSFSASVRSGVFNVNIGDTTNGFPHALDIDFNTNKNLYLQIEVSSNNSTFETLSPRQSITSSAFARLAESVSGTGASSFGTTTRSNAVVTIQATSSDSSPLLIQGFSGQTGRLLSIKNSALSDLLFVNATGGLFASSTLQVTGATTLFGALSGASAQFSDLTVSGLSSLSQASTTLVSILDRLYIGGVSTTTILGNGATSTFSGGIDANRINLSATSTVSGLRVVSGGLQVGTLDCSSFGNGGTLTTDAFGNVVCSADDGGSGGTVAGSDTQVQFNDGGAFGADSNFVWNNTTKRLGLGTSTPGTALAVEGSSILGNSATAGIFIATSTTATSTLPNTLATNIQTTNLIVGADSISDLTGTGLSISGGAL